jgi:SpoVK/Ycf46/Vps4 family AAA+-type ATPase
MSRYTIVSGIKSIAPHYAVVLPKETVGETDFVRITNTYNQKWMISRALYDSKVEAGTVHICNLTHASYIMGANRDKALIEAVIDLPSVKGIMVEDRVALGRDRQPRLFHSPPVEEKIYVAPNYPIKILGYAHLMKVMKGEGVYETGDLKKESKSFIEQNRMNSQRSSAASSSSLLDRPISKRSSAASSSSSAVSSNEHLDHETILPPETTIDINFNQMGIGGLSSQMDRLIRQVLISRIIDDDTRKQYNVKDIKGILLFGPPGTGKTLIAKKIGLIIKNSTITQINGPELSSKYVGETEENIRGIFSKARQTPDKTAIIIFDEIDAIGRRRGESSSNHDDKALTQLLTMIDGLGSANNVLIIGITNRKDILDPALIRSGRLECHIEIPIPTEEGRREILDIYLNPLRERNLVVDIDTSIWAKRLDSYSGADIESLIGRAKNLALTRNCDITDNTIRPSKDKLRSPIGPADMERAFEEFQPTFSKNDNVVRLYTSTHEVATELEEKFNNIYDEISLALSVPLTKPFVVNLPADESHRILACHLAKRIDLPYIRYDSYNNYLGFGSYTNCSKLNDIYFNCLQAEKSILILDCLRDVGDRALSMKMRHILEHPLDVTKQLVVIVMERDS